MSEKIMKLADRLDSATSSDTPRATMRAVASELRHLIKPGNAASDKRRDDAITLLDQIIGHQYGLRGFGDGSLSRGRDLTSAEKSLLLDALRYYAWKPHD